MILHDARNPTARRYYQALSSRLPEGSLPADLHVVIGGDGFLLHTVSELGLGPCYLGLNAGRVGFLLNDVDGDWAGIAERLRTGAFNERAFGTLAATIRLADGTTRDLIALNDVAIERSTGQTAHLELVIDGETVVERLVADGLIVSTALGSTAYTMSAGGPACLPTLGLIAVTAICAHKPRLAPLVLPESASARIRAIDAHRRPVRAVADGRTIDDVVGCTVGVHHERVRIGWLDGPNFTARMVTKILHT